MVSVRAGPNTPGKFIVWFRNETTLLVLWQPPYPPGAYTHYKVRRLYMTVVSEYAEGDAPGKSHRVFGLWQPLILLMCKVHLFVM